MILNSKKSVNNPGAALVILFGSFFFFMCVFSLLSGFIMPRISNPTVGLRVLTLLQAVFLFIIPALITAVVSTRLPASLLAIDKAPKLLPSLMIIVTIVAAIPLMNYIIEWNAGIQFPESMSALEKSIREMEEAAEEATKTILGGNTIGALIVSILIVGVMAGFSEELFFRGAFQRILGSTHVAGNSAVIVAAVVFSFMHFQFFGFVPRFLLGLFFGYILVWSNCLWYAIIAHAANNIMAVTVNWMNNRNMSEIDINTIGQSSGTGMSHITLIITSLIITSLCIIILHRLLTEDSKKLS